jgi:triosephosphate isomerase
MYKSQNDIQLFCQTFNDLLNNDKILVSLNTAIGIAPTYIGLSTFQKYNNTKTLLMAQNANAEINGAYTGEVSYTLLKDIQVNAVLLGHSEVRSHLHETDACVNKKVLNLLKADITVVLCIGETLEQFEKNQTQNILTQQLKDDLASLDLSNIKNLIIAYEPIWAIGTGKTATIGIVEKTLGEIKQILQDMFSNQSNTIPLLYGGSVNEKNAKDILHAKNVDGVLVGGASLDPHKFYNIIQSTPEYVKAQQ